MPIQNCHDNFMYIPVCNLILDFRYKIFLCWGFDPTIFSCFIKSSQQMYNWDFIKWTKATRTYCCYANGESSWQNICCSLISGLYSVQLSITSNSFILEWILFSGRCINLDVRNPSSSVQLINRILYLKYAFLRLITVC